MLTATVKTTKTKILGYICIFLAVIIAGILFFAEKEPQKAADSISRHVADNKSRIEYLSSAGVKALSEPFVVEEAVLPEKPDEVLAEYNEKQKAAGYNLEPYYGKTVKKYTYSVEDETEVYATLYVYENQIIAADISNYITGEQWTIDGRAKGK